VIANRSRLKTEIPDDVLVLPAHNSPFLGLHRRLNRLIDGHHRGLDRLQDDLSVPKRAIDVFGALFTRPISPEVLGMATGEALAHLNYLSGQGKLSRKTDLNGVQWWASLGLR